MDTDKQWLKPREAAPMLGVHWKTVKDWAEQGIIPYSLTPGGHFLFKKSDIEKYLEKRQVVPAQRSEQ